MTNREFFVAIAAGEMNDELMAHAQTAIAKMDATNAKRKEAPKKVSAETLEKRTAIVGALTEEPQTAAQLSEITGFSKNTIAGVLRAFITDGTVGKVDLKGLDANGKSATYKGYFLVQADAE